MYIQLTTKCNMTCAHCGMSATNKGKHMSRKIWKQAIKIARENCGQISIGGGEPTLHPDFWEIMGSLMGIGEDVSIWLATNGSQTDTSLALAALAKKGVIGCALSQDSYHDKIDPRVIKAFTREDVAYNRNMDDAREIRNVDNKLIKAGRCEDGEEGCICPDVFITPDGQVKGCGCADAPTFGNVFKYTLPEDWDDGECSKNQVK